MNIFSVLFWACICGSLLFVKYSDASALPINNLKYHLKSSPFSEGNALEIDIIGLDGTSVLATGKIGLGLPNAVGLPSDCSSGPDGYCYEWGDFAKVELGQGSHTNCFRVQWTSTLAKELEDCFELQTGVHWYGGGGTHTQTWPIENNPRRSSPYVTGDFMQSSEYYWGGVIENYWLLSSGAAVKVDDTVPLYFTLNTTRPNQACFTARDGSPFTKRAELKLGYEWCIGNNLKDAHKTAISTFYGKPSQTPDDRMLVQPLWSTWAEYKEDVDQAKVLEYARKVMSEGFVNSSHIEIDDNWESCYGEEEFNSEKFPDPKGMIDEIKGMNGMRATAWVHPFINNGCPKFDEAMKNGYFVQTTKPRTGLTWWWQGKAPEGSAVIDVTNPDAAAWWKERLRKLQEETGLTSFKFDAGESNWLAPASNLNNDTNSDLWPNLYTTAYVETVAEFGGLVETRSGRLNQKLSTFFRMWDKDSRWGYNNGLKSMIPTLFHFSIVGYPFVLPDMIGGNAYDGEEPTQELYVRWMQANIFMPAVQFSLVPWKIGETDEDKAETVRICLKVLEERERYSDHIIRAARQATEDGSPINRPLWWLDPDDKETLTIDDEYLLGDSILVAPVLEEGKVTRDIYLPAGNWRSMAPDSQTYEGPVWLRDFPAPLDVVPFFIKT